MLFNAEPFSFQVQDELENLFEKHEVELKKHNEALQEMLLRHRSELQNVLQYLEENNMKH